MEQHTGLLHFQHMQTGATLRATEVKPKLDCYITKRCERDEGRTVPASWKLGDTAALNYQLRFRLKGPEEAPVKPGSREPFFGNLNAKTVEDEKWKVYNTNIAVEVLCFIPELLAAIERYVCDFFICTNFGTRQDKGYGSFTVKDSEISHQSVIHALCEEYGANRVYCFYGGRKYAKKTSPDKKQDPSPGAQSLQRISTVYKIIKSGFNLRNKDGEQIAYRRSLLFLYMHEYFGIGNEKAWLKQNKYVPVQSIDGRDFHHIASDEIPPYVRALLGVGDHMDYIINLDEERNKDNLKTVHIKDSLPEDNVDYMARFPSPLFFKVISRDDNSIVYYVGNRIDPVIFEKKFIFEIDGQILTMPEIGTKSKNGKIIDTDFMDGFLGYCWTALNNQQPSEGNKLTDFPGMRGVYISEVSDHA